MPERPARGQDLYGDYSTVQAFFVNRVADSGEPVCVAKSPPNLDSVSKSSSNPGSPQRKESPVPSLKDERGEQRKALVPKKPPIAPSPWQTTDDTRAYYTTRTPCISQSHASANFKRLNGKEYVTAMRRANLQPGRIQEVGQTKSWVVTVQSRSRRPPHHLPSLDPRLMRPKTPTEAVARKMREQEREIDARLEYLRQQREEIHRRKVEHRLEVMERKAQINEEWKQEWGIRHNDKTTAHDRRLADMAKLQTERWAQNEEREIRCRTPVASPHPALMEYRLSCIERNRDAARALAEQKAREKAQHRLAVLQRRQRIMTEALQEADTTPSPEPSLETSSEQKILTGAIQELDPEATPSPEPETPRTPSLDDVFDSDSEMEIFEHSPDVTPFSSPAMQFAQDSIFYSDDDYTPEPSPVLKAEPQIVCAGMEESKKLAAPYVATCSMASTITEDIPAFPYEQKPWKPSVRLPPTIPSFYAAVTPPPPSPEEETPGMSDNHSGYLNNHHGVNQDSSGVHQEAHIDPRCHVAVLPSSSEESLTAPPPPTNMVPHPPTGPRPPAMSRPSRVDIPRSSRRTRASSDVPGPCVPTPPSSSRPSCRRQPRVRVPSQTCEAEPPPTGMIPHPPSGPRPSMKKRMSHVVIPASSHSGEVSADGSGSVSPTSPCSSPPPDRRRLHAYAPSQADMIPQTSSRSHTSTKKRQSRAVTSEFTREEASADSSSTYSATSPCSSPPPDRRQLRARAPSQHTDASVPSHGSMSPQATEMTPETPDRSRSSKKKRQSRASIPESSRHGEASADGSSPLAPASSCSSPPPDRRQRRAHAPSRHTDVSVPSHGRVVPQATDMTSHTPVRSRPSRKKQQSHAVTSDGASSDSANTLKLTPPWSSSPPPPLDKRRQRAHAPSQHIDASVQSCGRMVPTATDMTPQTPGKSHSSKKKRQSHASIPEFSQSEGTSADSSSSLSPTPSCSSLPSSRRHQHVRVPLQQSKVSSQRAAKQYKSPAIVGQSHPLTPVPPEVAISGNYYDITPPYTPANASQESPCASLPVIGESQAETASSLTTPRHGSAAKTSTMCPKLPKLKPPKKMKFSRITKAISSLFQCISGMRSKRR